MLRKRIEGMGVTKVQSRVGQFLAVLEARRCCVICKPSFTAGPESWKSGVTSGGTDVCTLLVRVFRDGPISPGNKRSAVLGAGDGLKDIEYSVHITILRLGTINAGLSSVICT